MQSNHQLRYLHYDQPASITMKEALDFVLNQLHTCRMMDTTWDEYMELILRLGILDYDNKPESELSPKPFFSKTVF